MWYCFSVWGQVYVTVWWKKIHWGLFSAILTWFRKFLKWFTIICSNVILISSKIDRRMSLNASLSPNLFVALLRKLFTNIKFETFGFLKPILSHIKKFNGLWFELFDIIWDWLIRSVAKWTLVLHLGRFWNTFSVLSLLILN